MNPTDRWDFDWTNASYEPLRRFGVGLKYIFLLGSKVWTLDVRLTFTGGPLGSTSPYIQAETKT